MKMERPVVVGIDIGTTKICTLVGCEESPGRLQILGVGIEPAQGIKKGVIVDLAAASQAVKRSIEKAERTSGMEINAAIVSMAGSQVSSTNSRGVVGVSGRVIDQDDILRAIESARAIPIPHNREIIHVIHRGFNVDGQEGIRMPIGMHGYRLEVETHIITASAASTENLRQCVGYSGVEVSQFVLNPLASAEVSLTETERQMGVLVCDIGGGTTDIALYSEGDVWYTAVLAVGGNHITSDIAQGLHLPLSQAEEIKIQHGHAIQSEVSETEIFEITPFGENQPVEISRADLANIIEARVEEIFGLVLQELKRSGYDGLLPAGIVLTGGSSLLPGMRTMANRIFGVPVRIARPEGLLGMSDRLNSPAFATSVGLLKWAFLYNEFLPIDPHKGPSPRSSADHQAWDILKEWLRRLLP
ncbi:MAG: cell division protein FtsA [Anaerolineales bacterium]|nr:cell division protein FtsA [Anaerolineales bacterium]